MGQDEHGIQTAVSAGDEQAFERLFRVHCAELTDFASGYLRTREAGEEVVQEVFLEIWARRQQLRFRESARAYLYRAVRNRCLNLLERGRIARRARRLLLAEEPIAPPPDAGGVLDPLHRALGRLVAELPPRTRLAVTLRYYHGLTHRETAEAMGISVKGVERLLGLALAKLRAQLAGRDVGEPPASLSQPT